MLLLLAALASSADFLFSYFLQDQAVRDKLCVNFPVVAVISNTDSTLDQSVAWSFPTGSSCKFTKGTTADQATGRNVTFACSATGMNTLKYTFTSGTETVTSDVSMFFESCNEFHWYARVEGAEGTQRLLNNGSDLEIWAVSSGIGDASECSHTASGPSDSSKNFVSALENSDTWPVITMKGSDGEVLSGARVNEPYYDEAKSRWTATVFFSDWTDMYVEIEPSTHDAAGGKIDVTQETLCPRLVNFDSVLAPLNLVKLASDVTFVTPWTFNGDRHPCVQNVACILNGDNLITTIDDFDTIDVWDVTSLGVKGLCMTMNALILLCQSEIIRLPFRTGQMSRYSVVGDRAVAPSSCLTLEDAEVATSSLDWVAIYTTAGQVMLSPDQGLTFAPLDVGSDVEQILDAEFLVTGKGTLHLCVKINGGSGTNTHSVRTFDPETGEVLSDFFFAGTTPQLRASDVGHLYLLDQVTRISTDTGATFAQLARGQGSTTTDNSHVTEISFSSGGELIVTRSNGILEYGRLDLNLVINLQAKASSRTTCRFDSLGRLELIEFPVGLVAGERSFPKYSITLGSEKEVAIESLKGQLNVQCPIRQFSVKMPAGRSAYLDLNTELVIETTTLSSNGVYPLTQTSDELEMEVFRNIVRTVELDPVSNSFYAAKRVDQNISLEGLKKGASHMILTVSGSTISCEDSVKILRVLVGCPKNRRVRIKGSNYIRLFYAKTRFRPELELLDGDNYVMDVESDFALYVTKENDDTPDDTVRYCMTAAAAGCVRKPQTWLDFDGYTDWNKSSYESCFEGEPEEYDATMPYPILNATGSNCIIFIPRNQVYKVRAVVLDPEFSHCHLSTEFTVEVWGQPMSIVWTIVIMVAVIVACFFVVVGVHMWDRWRFARWRKQAQDTRDKRSQ